MPAAPPPTRLSGLRVLVVDDDADQVRSTVSSLQIDGHDCRVAFSGPEALAAARRHRPDVVLLDLGLPDLDSSQVAGRLKAQVCDPPPFIIAVTGYGRPEDRRHSGEVGIDLHLVKPVDAKVLRGILARFSQIVAGR